MKTLDGHIVGEQSLNIHWQGWVPEQPKCAVLISHGLGEHGGRYLELAQSLVDIGCAVYAIDHRGHGRSEGKRGLIERFDYVLNDLDRVVDKVNEEHPEIPLLLLGHSMGGAIAVGYTLKHSSRLSGLILSGAALSSAIVPSALKVVGGILASIFPTLPAIAIAPENVSRDPDTVEQYSKDPLNLHSRVPLRTISEMVNAIAKLSKDYAKITLPTFVMHGSEDKLIPCVASQEFVEKIASDDKMLTIYPELYHEIFNELPEDRQDVIDDTCHWIRARFA